MTGLAIGVCFSPKETQSPDVSRDCAIAPLGEVLSEGTSSRLKFGQGLPPAGGWKRDMVKDTPEREALKKILDLVGTQSGFLGSQVARLAREGLGERGE